MQYTFGKTIPMHWWKRHNVKLKFLKCVVFAMAAAAGPSLAAPGMVYIADEGSDTVSVVNTGMRQAVATITVGASPHGIRVSPDGTQVWVANLKGGTVAVIDTQTRKQIAQISASLWARRQHTVSAKGTEPGAVDERTHYAAS